ncbi:CD1375 family protein [Neglectibacter caecimuris]|nr:CD1375 family protein [Neglectibacter sp. M00184]
MIARVYAELIRKGKKTLGDVPKSLQEAVQVELNRQGTIGNE